MEFYNGHLMSEINILRIETERRYVDIGHSNPERFAKVG